MRKTNWFILFLLWILIWWIIIKFWPNENIENIINQTIENKDNKYERFDLLNYIFEESYVDIDKLDYDKMLSNAVKAYVDGIWDPYTVYMDAEQNSGFMDDLDWEDEFEWIWAVVTKKDYYIQIEEVLKESPAFKAWLIHLDRIIKIDTWYVEDETLDDAVKRMKWPAWTKVNVVIERIVDNKKELIEKEIVREKITVPSVKLNTIEIEDKKIAYIEMFIIWEYTDKLLRESINQIEDIDDMDWVILDLRWNGWGIMEIAVEIISHFVPKDELVLISKYRWYEDERYFSKWYGEFQDLKTIVLVDWMTASAWEIIALALQEQIWAKIVWSTTFGKGTIQTMYEFEDWESIKYTVGKWLSPNQRFIDKVGLDPDIIVEFDMDTYINSWIDNQLEEAKHLFLK